MELSKNELRGITLVTQALSKKFKFIDGWQLNKNSHLYEAILFIDLIVDPQEFIKYYNLSEENIDSTLFEKFSVSTLFSLTSFGLSFGDEEQRTIWKEKFDFFYEEKKIIEKQLESFYEMIPENLQKKNKYGNPIGMAISNFVSP
mgnify:CR=1 FL=1